ncbi:hypothetical protein H8356DRAFT_1088429 [Neocallimastix lanati (nom. inval.)]|nr:hypothetical protein H8356DRAFT_1088429 [Neocallimastix sp. JGI-2020a]
MEIYKTQNDVEDLKKRLNIFKVNANNNVKQLENNFNYNQEVIKEAQRTLQTQDEAINTQHKLIEDLNNKVITIYNTLQTSDKGKNNVDEVSLTRLNQTKKELETLKAEMDLKFKLQDKLVSSYSKVQENLTKIATQLNNYQDQIDNINNQLELENTSLSEEKINELTNSQKTLLNKYNNTLETLNNIKINNLDIDKNFKEQIKTINENISKYNLNLHNSDLQKQYQNLVLQHPKTTKFFKYEVTKNGIILKISDPKYANLFDRLILKHYQSLWEAQTGLNQPTIDDLSYYIDGNYDDLEISENPMDQDKKSFIGNSTMEDFKKTFGEQLRKELKEEIEEEKATTSKNTHEIKEAHDKAILEMKQEYDKLSNMLKNTDNLNKEEINKLLIEFDNLKKLMDNKIKEDKILQKQEIKRQLKQIKHEDLRDRIPNRFREKSKLDYTYNTIDFEESYGTYNDFIKSLQNDHISDEEYFSAIMGKTYKPNEKLGTYENRVKKLENQVIPKEPQSIPQWYFIKEHNEEERINNHQQVVAFSPDEFEAIKDVEGSSLLFYRAFKHDCPKYRGKSTGYDDLRDFKFYLQNYAPPSNEIQIINTFEYFVDKKEETKRWYKKEKKNVLNKLRENPRLKGVLMWYEFNKIISRFDYKFCEFTQSEQENYWNNIKPIQSLNADNLKVLVQQIEKVSVNLNKEYGEMVIKLISCIHDSKYIKYLQKNMCKLPVINKSVDLKTRNSFNKSIYLDTLRILYTKLQENEGNISIKKNFDQLFNYNSKQNPKHKIKNLAFDSKISTQKLKKSSKKLNFKNPNRKHSSHNTSHNKIILGDNTEVNNIEDSSSRSFTLSNPINNPKFARIKWNRGMTFTNNGIKDIYSCSIPVVIPILLDPMY